MQTIWQKFTSRKFWLALGAIVGLWAGPEISAEVQAVLTAVIAAAYALGEGIADAGRGS